MVTGGRSAGPGAPAPGPVRRWVLGARPRTLPAAVVPVVVGAAAAWWAWHHAQLPVLPGVAQPGPAAAPRLVAAGPHPVAWWRCGLALVVSLALQVGVNYANDYSDGIRGTDQARVGPLRLVASGLCSPRSVKVAAWLAFAVAGVAGLVLAAVAGWWLLAVGATSVLAAWFYTGGPRPYGYVGLGELFVLVFFGLVATAGTTYVAVGTFPGAALVAAVAVGLLATALLEANNVRDIGGDRAAGKHTLAVRLGRRRAAWLYVGSLAAAAAAVVAVAVCWAPWAALALAAVPLARRPVQVVLGPGDGPRLLPVLSGTARVQLGGGLLLAVGFVVGGLR